MAVCDWCHGEMTQMMSCGCRFDEDGPHANLSLAEPLGVDGNGLLTEPDMVGRRGAELLRRALPPSGSCRALLISPPT